MEGLIYPNDTVVQWDLLIVVYPYITGLVAGAFIVSSLYHLFGVSSLKPVARFSLITALAFALVAPLPLLVHSGHPERALEMFLTPNLASAMSAFGYILLFYILLLVVEIWLVFRRDIVVYYQRSTPGAMKTVYSILALGVYDVSDESLERDDRIIKILAAIGVPAACLLHGYVGAIFGAIKANPWWTSPLMPIIFLLSAIVSGIALLLVLYVVVSKIRKTPLDHSCLHSLYIWLGGFLTLAVALEGLEVVGMLYMSEESWEIISELISRKLAISYFGIQFGFGAVLPLIVLAVAVSLNIRKHTKMVLGVFSAASILIGVFAMRWNVVVGGQLFSKSLRGFTSYVPEVGGKEGIVVAVLLMLLPFGILALIAYLLPPWQEVESTIQADRRVGNRWR
jgi:Ni/Fe-hydrogenase subunit HybB-like protein